MTVANLSRTVPKAAHAWLQLAPGTRQVYQVLIFVVDPIALHADPQPDRVDPKHEKSPSQSNRYGTCMKYKKTTGIAMSGKGQAQSHSWQSHPSEEIGLGLNKIYI